MIAKLCSCWCMNYPQISVTFGDKITQVNLSLFNRNELVYCQLLFGFFIAVGNSGLVVIILDFFFQVSNLQ